MVEEVHAFIFLHCFFICFRFQVLRHFGDPSVGAGDSLLHTDEFEPFVNVNLINDPASSSSSPFGKVLLVKSNFEQQQTLVRLLLLPEP
jgi:hypothetical protein